MGKNRSDILIALSGSLLKKTLPPLMHVLGTPTPKSRDEELRVAMLTTGAKDDYEWGMGIWTTAQKYLKVIRGACEQGVDIFFGLDAGVWETYNKIASLYPNTWFEGHCIHIDTDFHTRDLNDTLWRFCIRPDYIILSQVLHSPSVQN